MRQVDLPAKPEILAPAGSPEKLETALLFGADAVYLAGRQFGLRAFAANFSQDELLEAVKMAHARGKKVYVTVNIYAHQEDLSGLTEYFAFLNQSGADGILISDPGVFALACRYAPLVPKQISTQASVTNAAACRFWYDLGVRRVVLARELTLNEIKSIRENVPADLELEAFVHGAMCMSYSGRCLLSNYLTERDGNRGRCAQPCRWKYRISDINHPGQALDLEEDERGTYMLSSNDLCMIEYIPQLVQAGINSFKIEGRMKGAYYAAVVTKAYREALDRYYEDPENYTVDPQAFVELCSMVHRTYATGFYFSKPQKDAQIFSQATYVKEAVVLAVVKETLGDGRVLCEQRNKMSVGDHIQVVAPKGPTVALTVNQLTDLEGGELTATPHPQMEFYLHTTLNLSPGSFLRRLGDKDNDPAGIGGSIAASAGTGADHSGADNLSGTEQCSGSCSGSCTAFCAGSGD